MIVLQPKLVLQKLNEWKGRTVYFHLEVNPGAYFRNAEAVLEAAHVKGDGPYRLFLEVGSVGGLIQVNSLTHMSIDEDLVICTGYDDQDRIAQTIEISSRPFSM